MKWREEGEKLPSSQTETTLPEIIPLNTSTALFSSLKTALVCGGWEVAHKACVAVRGLIKELIISFHHVAPEGQT